MTTTDTHHGQPDPHYPDTFYQSVLTKRLIAFVIDSIMVVLITMILIPLSAFTALFFLPILGFIVSVVYRAVSLSNGSATPGMRLTGIEFRDVHGEHFSSGTALAHTILSMVALSVCLPQLISLGMMLTTTRKQGLVDMFLGTVVINKTATY